MPKRPQSFKVNISEKILNEFLTDDNCRNTVKFLRKLGWKTVTDPHVCLANDDSREVILDAKQLCWDYEKGIAVIVFSMENDGGIPPYMVIFQDPKAKPCLVNDFLKGTYSFVDGLTNTITGVVQSV